MPPSVSHPALSLFISSAIPDLQPIEELLPPTFWEQHRVAILLGGLLALAIFVVVAWWLRRTRPVQVAPPADLARKALRKLETGPDNGLLAGAVLKTLRGYLPAAIPTLPRGELTADEMIVPLRHEAALAPELREEIAVLLHQCEQRQFFHGRFDTPSGLAARALALIDKVEAAQAGSSAIPAAPP